MKTENFELKKNLEKYKLNLTQKLKECENLTNKLNSLYKLDNANKNKIKTLEEENRKLRSDILNNNSDSEKEENNKNALKNTDRNDNNKLQKKLVKEISRLEEENEKLQKYIVSSEFRYSLSIKAIFENKKLKQERNKYKEELDKLNK